MPEGAALLTKLQITGSARIWLLAAPDGFARAIGAEPGITLATSAASCDAAVVFVETPAQVKAFAAEALAALSPDGLLWLAYRKGAAGKAAGLTRDHGWEALERADWRPVRSIAIDDTWTGLRFRPVALVKSKSPEAWRTRAQG